MHQSFALFLVVVLATLALAAPAPKPILSKRSFAVPRLRTPGYVRSPSKAMARAYRKFGWQMIIPTGLDFDSAISVTNDQGQGPSTTTVNLNLGNVLGGVLDSGSDDSSSPIASSAPESYGATNYGGSKAAGNAKMAAHSAAPYPTNSSEGGEDETGEVVATPAAHGAEYLSPVTIGGQKLNLNFDTGSADLWVFSSKLPSSSIGQHSAFDPSKSSSYSEIDGSTFSLSYGDGSGASGIVGIESVDIGGATVTRQAIELATSVSSSFVQDADSDGLVGLGFSSLNSVKPRAVKTFFENIMDELEQPLFTADLDLDGSGTYEFGTIDNSKFKGDLTFAPIDPSSGFWQIESTSYSIGGKKYNRNNASPAIVDTGTSLLLMDPEVVDAFYKQIPSAVNDQSVGGYTYKCSDNIPDFAVAIGDNYMATIPGKELSFAYVDDTTCFGGVQTNAGSNLQIFGDALLKHHFVVFNGRDNVVGIANKE